MHSLPTGNVQFVFNHTVDNDSLKRYSFLYQNAAGNPYEIDDLKYFISGVRLYYQSGKYIEITNPSIHYIDLDYPASLNWNIENNIPTGHYDSISFTFGLKDDQNQSNFFTNPPEINMFWPDALGGGYHFLMCNGKWRKPDNSVSGFNLHLGKGQMYSGTTQSPDSIVGFINNDFRVHLPNSSFYVVKNKTTQITLNMNINNWFSQPYMYDFNYWGASIMQNQAAMFAIRENGSRVFSVQSIQ